MPEVPYRLDSACWDSRSASSAFTDHHVLLVLGLDTHCEHPAHIPFAQLGFREALPAQQVEVWFSNRPVTYHQEPGLQLAEDGQTLMGVATFTDTDTQLTEHTQQLYDQIFSSCARYGYPALYRMWNFIPRINEPDAAGLERYRAFCKGRAQAFFDDGHYAERMLPAGTGVGVHTGPVTVAFLAGTHDQHLNLENPRQIPAYHYPCAYGPKSPSFARATCVPRPDHDELYISGTSSIIGHETVCAGDLAGQAETTFANLRALISDQNLGRYGHTPSLDLAAMQRIKVYVRHREQFDAVKTLCQNQFPNASDIVYLQADICRSDLLLEIEGVFRLPRNPKDQP